HVLMDPSHPIDRPLGILGRRVCGFGDKTGGALQASPWIMAVIRKLRHRGHRQGMQRLEQQGADPADKHGRVAVNPTDDAVLIEPALSAIVVNASVLGIGVRTGDRREQRIADLAAQSVNGVIDDLHPLHPTRVPCLFLCTVYHAPARRTSPPMSNSYACLTVLLAG